MPGPLQSLVALREQQVDHESDDLARREALARGFVRLFREAPNEFYEDDSRLVVGDVGFGPAPRFRAGTRSRRRSRMKGSVTRPYSDGL